LELYGHESANEVPVLVVVLRWTDRQQKDALSDQNRVVGGNIHKKSQIAKKRSRRKRT